jgi:collagenase-like PrtC family protease
MFKNYRFSFTKHIAQRNTGSEMMKKLTLIAPARSKYMLNQMLDAGANEIYVGLKFPKFNQLSFDDRFQTIAGHPAHVRSLEELQSMIEIAKKKNIKINFMANAPYVPEALQDDYVRFVEQAVSMGIDYITVSSIQTIKLLKKSGIGLPIVAGSSLGPTNIYMVRLLKEMGVFRITVPHCVKLEELKRWKEEGLEMITIGNFEKGSIPGSSRLWESPNHLEIGEGERTSYKIELPNGQKFRSITILDSSTDCNLCSLEALAEAGITGIKLIGREAPNPATLAAVVDLYRQWIEMGVEGIKLGEKIQIMEQEQLMWVMRWVPRFCEKNRCTYLNTPILAAYV